MICFLHKKGLVKPNSSDRSELRSPKQWRFQISAGIPCTCPCEAWGFVCRNLQGLKSSPVHVAGRSAEVTGPQDTGLQSPTKNKTSKHFSSPGRAQQRAGIYKCNAAPHSSGKGLCLEIRLFFGDLTTSIRSVSAWLQQTLQRKAASSRLSPGCHLIPEWRAEPVKYKLLLGRLLLWEVVLIFSKTLINVEEN